MPQVDAFRRTIQDRPDDDGPRLVFADWLEEHGECDRAELIRLQCQGGNDERVHELVHLYGASWAGPVARHAYGYAFCRGFIEEMTISATALLDQGEEIFEDVPIRLLRIIGVRSKLDRLLDWPPLERVRALHLTGCALGDEGTVLLAACPLLRGLRTLRLGNNAIGDGGLEALVDSPWLTGLHTFVLRGNLIGDAGAQVLATVHHFMDLQDLDLSENQIGDAGAEAIVRAKPFPRLTRLELSDQFKGWSADQTVRGRPYPIQPKQQQALTARFGASVCVF